MEFLDLECAASDFEDNEENVEITDTQLQLFSGDFINDVPSSDDDSVIPPNPYVHLSDSDATTSSKRSRDDTPVSSTSPAKKKGGDSPAMHWCFTCFNYNEDTESGLTDLFPDTIEYLCYGKEVCKTTKRPHLQGYFKLKDKKRFTQVLKFFNVAPHIEKCKGSPKQNYLYCTKEDPNAVELGVFPGPERKKQKMQIIIEKLVAGCNISDICNSDLCHVFVSSRDKILKTVKDIKEEKRVEEYKKKDADWGSLKHLRDWQHDLLKVIKEKQGNDRAVIWVFDTKGGVGKSYLCNEMKKKHYKNVALLESGSVRDISFIYEGEPTVFFDYSRDEQNHINYSVIEKIKDGRIMSVKYAGTLKMFKSPVICCMANFPPVVEKLSMDRWCIFQVENSRLVPKPAETYLGMT